MTYPTQSTKPNSKNFRKRNKKSATTTVYCCATRYIFTAPYIAGVINRLRRSRSENYRFDHRSKAESEAKRFEAHPPTTGRQTLDSIVSSSKELVGDHHELCQTAIFSSVGDVTASVDTATARTILLCPTGRTSRYVYLPLASLLQRLHPLSWLLVILMC